jgi:EAL and modified HD-GYP domain-containing signal transduction protein
MDDVYIARQPVLDLNQAVYGYELLARSGLQHNVYDGTNLSQASASVIVESLLLLGLTNLTSGKKAFINVTRDVLVRDLVWLLPKESTIVEILENVEPDEEVVAACRRLKEAGYLLALDDFVYEERYEPLLDITDIVKVDFLSTPPEQQRALVERLSPRGVRLVAEKVETHEVFMAAAEMGYSLFQGYFFCKPLIVSAKGIPGSKIHRLQLLVELRKPELDFRQLEAIIKRDLSLSYKLLRYLNSAAFSWQRTIGSITQALQLLGDAETKRWASIITLADMGKDSPEELVQQTILRARVLELMASKCGLAHRADDLFLMGMFSLIDAFLGRPLPDVLEEIALPRDVKAALLGEPGALRQLYECALAYERGDWEALSELAAALGVDDKDLAGISASAYLWAHEHVSGLAAD